jgi:4-carboxymuconolactone decarboxylase
MRSDQAAAQLHRSIQSFAPDSFGRERSLALFSAAIAVNEPDLMTAAVVAARRHGADRAQLYEIVLQSYLFLGFPCMLTAADTLNQALPATSKPTDPIPSVDSSASDWVNRGARLCKTVYADNYERLRARVIGMAPEIFQWMIFEGYGKVLSRPGLDIVTRELAIVSCLMINNRPVQLYSHMRGALNVGATTALLRLVVNDIGDAAGAGRRAALEILSRLEAA